MSDWKKTKYPAGTRVKVDDLSGRQMFNGTLVHDFDADAELPAALDVNDTPELLLDDGRRLRGCECWWIPMEEALAAAEAEIARLRTESKATIEACIKHPDGNRTSSSVPEMCAKINRAYIAELESVIAKVREECEREYRHCTSSGTGRLCAACQKAGAVLAIINGGEAAGESE